MAIVSNLPIDQGTTYSVTILVQNDDGTVRDLSGYAGRAQLRRSYYTNTNTAFTVDISDAANGELTLSLTSAQTSALKAGRYVYDVEIQANISGSVERVVEGIVTIYPEVTK